MEDSVQQVDGEEGVKGRVSDGVAAAADLLQGEAALVA
jgi:hypothetical protein